MGPWLILGCSFWHTDLIGITPRGLSKVPQDWRKGMNDQRLRSFPPDNHDQAHLLQRPRPCCGRASISDSQNLSGISAFLGKEFTRRTGDAGGPGLTLAWGMWWSSSSSSLCWSSLSPQTPNLSSTVKATQLEDAFRFFDKLQSLTDSLIHHTKRDFFFSIKCAKLSMSGPPYAKVPHILTSPDCRDSPSLPGMPGICPRGTHTNASTHSFLTTSCQHPSWPALDPLPEGFAQCCLFQ